MGDVTSMAISRMAWAIKWRHNLATGAKPLLLLMLASTTAGCDLQSSEVVVQVVCARIVEYDAKTQDRALAEYDALPAGSALRLFIGDYKQLRDQIRICRARAKTADSK